MKQIYFIGLCLLLLYSGYAQEIPESGMLRLAPHPSAISLMNITEIAGMGDETGIMPDEEAEEGDDDEILVHPTQYFIILDPNEHPDTIELLKELLNSDEIWYRPEINLRLWVVQGFPYTDPATGNPVTDIQGQVVVARSKTKINDVGFNVVDEGMTVGLDGNEVCFDQIDFTLPQGLTPVKVSILDTGIGDLSNYNDPNYTFDLTEYTGYDYIHDDFQPDDEHGHGTGIAGLIYHITETADGANSVLFDIRKTHDAEGQGLVSHIIPAILDAVIEGARIINMSFSYLDYRVDTLLKPLQLAITYGESHNVLFFAASGNTGFDNNNNDIISFPASFQNDGILSIASSKCNMDLSSFSSYGASAVDVVVVGEHIPVPNIENGTYAAHGTSYSCAIASAMAAVFATCHSGFNASALKNVFVNSAIYNSNLGDKVLTEGFVEYETAYSYSSQGCGQSSNAQQVPALTHASSTITPTLNQGQFTVRFTMEARGNMDLRILNQMGNVVYTSSEFYETGQQEKYVYLKRVQPTGRMTVVCKTPTKLEVLGFIIM